MKNRIIYRNGDATLPEGEGNKVIVHICNDEGGWGKGFVLAVSRRWKRPETEYRKMSSSSIGDVQFVQVEDGMYVANMIAQHGTQWRRGIPPIRYGGLRRCLVKVRNFVSENECSVHMPKIGAGLAGGDWDQIEGIIVNELVSHGIPVTVYYL